MQVTEATFILLTLILLSSIIAIYLLMRIPPQNREEKYYRVNDSNFRSHLKMKASAGNFILDPYETKLLSALLNDSNGSLDVKKINEILNLTKLSKENQRQRRHIILKELNLKLFLISGIRETVTRVASESDKRVKYYTLLPEIVDNKSIKELIPNHP